MDKLLHAIRRYADVNADAAGVAATPVCGLSMIRATSRSALQYAINRPLVALVVQGGKRVTMGGSSFDFGAGDSLIIAADVPIVSQITQASAGVPYYSFVLELDPAIIEPLALEMHVAQASAGPLVRVDPTEAEAAEAALRLVRAFDRPAVLPILQAQLVRELYVWLLAGRHGPAIRALGVTDSRAQRIGRAVALIRERYHEALRVERLAETAGMSLSSFHEHFRAITSLSPLQFQKQLRLIEARRMMISEGEAASSAAYAVGYASIPQFTRDYGRLFGVTPVRDVREANQRMTNAA
jgi:AraC-like DNA-binding protein